MYKGNGVTKEFPLPPGADGSVVALVTESGAVRMKEGDAYEVVGGSVVFGVAPPEGVTVAFAMPEGAVVSSRFCTVIYADGRMMEVSKDPAELLVQVVGMFDESKKALRHARAMEEKAENLLYIEAEKVKKQMELGLFGLSAEAQKAIEEAVATTKDELTGQLSKNLLEIRNKYKAVLAAHAEIEGFVRDADRMASTAAGAAEQLVHACCEDAMKACEEIKRARAETLGFRDEAENAASNAAALAARGFEARADLVLEEVKSLRSTLQGEIRALVEGTKTKLDAGLQEIRAQREEMARGIRHMNKIERFAIEKEDEIKALAARIVERGNA